MKKESNVLEQKFFCTPPTMEQVFMELNKHYNEVAFDEFEMEFYTRKKSGNFKRITLGDLKRKQLYYTIALMSRFYIWYKDDRIIKDKRRD